MAVRFDPERREWHLEDGDLLYVLGLDDSDRLRTRYLGSSTWHELTRADGWSTPPDPEPRFLEEWWELRFDLEYPARGPYIFSETALAVSFGDADRDVDLRFGSYDITGEHLIIELHDRFHELVVRLNYRLSPGSATVRRWAEIGNLGTSPAHLEQAAAFSVCMRPAEYVLHHLTGEGLLELQPVAEVLTAGRKVIESRRGMTGHKHQPWFALENADDGEIVFGALEWSGNWKLGFETDLSHSLAVVGGMHEFDFDHVLEPGEVFTTPAAVLGVTRGGLDDAARAMHRYVNASVLPVRPGDPTLPIIFEGWYVNSGIGITADSLIADVGRAADIGVELFIVTAGWYTDIQAGFDFLMHEGDWNPRPDAFPLGLEQVAREARRRGMRFGLWVEPEAVSADSDLFREHPEWVFQTVRGPNPTAHGQMLLNLARPDVYAHVRNDLFRLIERYELDYLRTDLNQPFRELSDPSGASGPGRDLSWRHVSNYYRLLDEVRRAFPSLIIENCAGGGGRIDLGMLQRTDTVWLSDTTDQFARLSMFMAGTSFLPQRVCENWITYPGLRPGGESSPARKPPAYDTDFGFRVAMLGNIGVSADLEHVPGDWLARARHHLARYKELRSTIQLGELHRLTAAPPRDGSGTWCAAAMVADDASEAVVFCFRLASGEATAVFRVPGLEPTSMYSVAVDDGGGVEQRSGAQLAEEGIAVTVPRTHSSQLLTVRRLDR